MKYLKLFDTEDNYLAYRDGSSYLKPNVSLCDDNGKVYYNYSPFNGYDYVDLGLPSGALWATMNVGASKPSDAGLYFQWGDTQGYSADQVGNGEGQKKFDLNFRDYKWGTSSNFTKYTTTGAALELEDDAAHVNMGGSWHMPSPQQIQELLDNTTHPWTTQDGVNGRLFTSKTDNSKSIFIPAAGYASYGSLRSEGSEADVWSSLLNAVGVDGGQYLYFNSVSADLSYGGRCYGGCRAWRGWLGFIHPSNQTNFLTRCLQGAQHPQSILLEN